MGPDGRIQVGRTRDELLDRLGDERWVNVHFVSTLYDATVQDPDTQISIAHLFSPLLPRLHASLQRGIVDVVAVLCAQHVRGKHTIEALQGEDPSLQALKRALASLLLEIVKGLTS